jgi:hypothetical protein
MDAIALGKDIFLGLGMPVTGMVAKVSAGL